MSVLSEALIAAPDWRAKLLWPVGQDANGTGLAQARFELARVRVEATFTEAGPNEWRVAFEAASQGTASENIHASIRIFSGVFQAVREFLEVRQPERLVFASSEEYLGQLYEEYLQRQDTPLRQLGYRMVHPARIAPLTESAIEKATPSEWKDISGQADEPRRHCLQARPPALLCDCLLKGRTSWERLQPNVRPRRTPS